jgi:GNAT superfamily N-acetyltransferase
MLKQLAEAPDRYTYLSTDVDRHTDDEVCVVQGPTWAAVSDVHTRDVKALIARTRELVPPEKHPIWWIGPSCEPADLHEQLQALGFRTPGDRADRLHAMATTSAPPESPGIEVRRVETFDDFVTATHVAWNGFGIPAERRERERVHLRTVFDATRTPNSPCGFLAFLEGEPVGVGRSVYSDRGVFLIGGAVLEHARGRGVYRALIRARWDDAVERGTPGMIVEAMPDTSYPILKGLGFEEVCIIRRLEDPR